MTDLSWMISRWAQETPGVIHTVLLARDGLAIAASHGLERDQVDKTAATAASLIALANAISSEYDAGASEILTFRTPGLHFLFMGVADRAALAVLAERESNLSVVGHQMQRFVSAVGARLDPGPRPSSVAHPAGGLRPVDKP
jgi:uncharacterized protein